MEETVPTLKSTGTSKGGKKKKIRLAWVQEESDSRITAISSHLYRSHRIIISLFSTNRQFHKALRLTRLLPIPMVSHIGIQYSENQCPSVLSKYSRKKKTGVASVPSTPTTRKSLPLIASCNYSCSEAFNNLLPGKHQLNRLWRTTSISVHFCWHISFLPVLNQLPG